MADDGGATRTGQLSPPEAECLQKLKVALATTLIRNKPRGVSSREFASRLSDQLKSGERNWKDKAKRLEEELLSLKQDLVLAELDKTRGSGVHLQENFSDPEFAVSLLPNTTVMDLDIPLLTPPSSSEALPPENPCEKIFQSNANFLCSLSRLELLLSGADSQSSLDNASDVIARSIRNMSEYYRNWLELEHLPKCAIEKGPSAISRVLGSSLLDCRRDESVKELGALIQCCLGSILNCKRLCRMEFLESAATLVTTLARSRHLQKPALRSIAGRIKEVGDGLRTNISQQTPLDIAACENVVCLLRIFENIITAGDRTFIAGKEVLKELKDQLEDCVLHLTEVFPLFTQYVWNILGVMEFMLEGKMEE